MLPRSLSHLSDRNLTHGLQSLVARDRATTAELLAHLAEFDTRKLYRPAGFSSLYDYCVQELGMSEDMACKRVIAARMARRHGGILPAIADGRLHLSGVVMLAPHLKQAPAQARELLAAAERRTKAEIALLIATRFPSPDVPTSLRPIGSSAPGRMEFIENSAFLTPFGPSAPPRPRIAPLSAESYELRGTISRRFHEKLVRIQELLSHAVPSGDVIEILERCADAFIARAERTGSTGAPKSSPEVAPVASDPSQRHVPLELRRVVSQRDGGRCAFVIDSGRRCPSRRHLEFDHIVPLAKGGRTTLENLRLLCRAHNQHMAEVELGREFMQRIAVMAEESREFARATARAKADADARAAARTQEHSRPPAAEASHGVLDALSRTG